MANIQTEILISLIDKGLLAFVLVLIGYYFNKKLERLRINYNHRKIVEEYRIKAYQDIAVSCQKYGKSVEEFFDFMKQIAKPKLSEKEKKDILKKAEPKLEKLDKLRDDFIEAYYRGHMFLSYQLAQDLIRFLETANKLSKILDGSCPDNTENIIRLEKITEDIVQVIQTIVKHINSAMV